MTHALDLGQADVHVDGPMGRARKTKTPTEVPMAEISTKQRKALPKSEFADPANRAYPIHDKAHADNAAARLEQQKGSMSSAKYRAIKARITAAQKRFGESKAPTKKKQLHVRADIAEGGSLHVRHMSDHSMALEGVLIELADKTDGPVWIQIAKAGSFKGHVAGPFELNDQVFAEIVRNFKATENQRIPIDYEHASEADPTEGSIPVKGAPAQGWILDMKTKPGSLWGLVDWLAQAREQIRSGQYKFFSPAIRFNARDRVTGQPIGARMTSGALTNNPFLDGMTPLAAKDTGASATMKAALAHAPHEYMPAVKRALKLHELATPAECSDHLGKLRDMVDGCDGEVGMTSDGVDLTSYAHPLRDLVGAKPGDTWDEIFDAVESLIDAAMEKHELEYHAGEAPMTDDGGLEDDDTAMQSLSDRIDLVIARTKLELRHRGA